MSVLDRANAYIGHPKEIDEGFEITVERKAYIQGYQDALDNAVQWLFENVFDYLSVEGQNKVADFINKMEE